MRKLIFFSSIVLLVSCGGTEPDYNNSAGDEQVHTGPVDRTEAKDMERRNDG
jgi:hypothetical protein